MSAKLATRARPPITLCETDADRLTALALAGGRAPGAELLLQEIDRARVVPDGRAPADLVRLGSTVEFSDEESGARRTVRLVLPQEADINAGRISVLTPVGAGLIGLRPGQSILWPDRAGRERPLRILSVGA